MVYSVALSASMMLAAVTSQVSDPPLQSNGWRLSLSTDRFANLTTCRLASVKQRMLYQAGSLGFNIGRFSETTAVWYRIDRGSPMHWQDKLPIIRLAGAEIDGLSLDNPTGGWVWIPTGELGEARIVEICGDRASRVRRFTVGGFPTMLDAARRLGCTSDDNFRS